MLHSVLETPNDGYLGFELVVMMLCRLDGWEGRVEADSAEVHAWRYVSLDDIRLDMQRSPDNYTAWFRDELHATNLSDPKIGGDRILWISKPIRKLNV